MIALPPLPQFPFRDPKRPNQLEQIKPRNVVGAFKHNFRTSNVTNLLERVTQVHQYKEMKGIRNIVGHRAAAAGRALGYTSLFGSHEPPVSVKPWAIEGITLGGETTATPFEWLQETLDACLIETERFIWENMGN
jgi:hypothetical protein